jgi:hypothetical protein
VSRELTVEFGQAFTLRSLYRAIQFCQSFADQEIVSTLSTQLSWSHFIELLPIKDPLAREFYAEMCRIEHLLIVWGPVWAGQMLSTSPARGSPLSKRRSLRFIRPLFYRFLLGLLFANWQLQDKGCIRFRE